MTNSKSLLLNTTYREFYGLFGFDNETRPEFMFHICFLLRNEDLAPSLRVAFDNEDIEHMFELNELADILLADEDDGKEEDDRQSSWHLK